MLADKSRGDTIVNFFGSPATWLESDLTRQAAGQDLMVQEAATTKLAQIREELCWPDPTPIERLLAERASVCWFRINRYESYNANAKDVSLRQPAYHQERIDRVHKRLLSAVKTLATVRKLDIPAIQVNIGRSQLNVAGSQA